VASTGLLGIRSMSRYIAQQRLEQQQQQHRSGQLAAGSHGREHGLEGGDGADEGPVRYVWSLVCVCREHAGGGSCGGWVPAVDGVGGADDDDDDEDEDEDEASPGLTAAQRGGSASAAARMAAAWADVAGCPVGADWGAWLCWGERYGGSGPIEALLGHRFNGG
jgi:hypothetical protein